MISEIEMKSNYSLRQDPAGAEGKRTGRRAHGGSRGKRMGRRTHDNGQLALKRGRLCSIIPK